MPHRTTAGRLALAWGLITLVAAHAHAEAPPLGHTPHTPFLPSRDLLPIANPSGRGTATGGSCHGVVEAALVYKARTAGDPGAPTLSDIAGQIEDRFGYDRAKVLLDGLAVASQHHVYQQTTQYVQPDWGKRTVFENLKTSLDAGKPVLLSLLREDGGGHIVVAYDYHRDPDGGFQFRVGDPNHPRDDARVIGYDLASRSFDAYGAGSQPFEVYAVQRPLERQPERFLDYIEAARTGTVPREDFVPPPDLHIEEEEQAAVVNDPAVGGVLIRFPTAWYAENISDAELARLNAEVARAARMAGKGGALIARTERSEALQLVPIAALLAPGARTLGELTRVRGWVVAEGQMYLAGLVEAGEPPIPLDFLTVALELVWRRAETPYVSLDPDPADLFGIQKPRVGGVPDALRDTAFVRTLLAADYAMKEITLGTRPVAVPRYRTLETLIATEASKGAAVDDAEVLFRLWLTPLALPAADVLETRAGNDSALLFESHVQVLTETMMREGGLLVGTGRREPIAETAAGDFTRHFDALAREVPVLGRLRTAFDLAKLALLLRVRGVPDGARAELSRLAELSVAHGEPGPSDEPAPPWRGIGPRMVAGTDRVIGGGAVAKVRARPAAILATDRLAPLIASARARASGPVPPTTVTLPATLDLQGAAAGAAVADLAYRDALGRLREGDHAGALERLDRVLASDPDDVEALVARALVRALLHADGARADAVRAAGIDPRQRALVAVLSASAPDPASRAAAATEADDAERAHPDDAWVIMLVAQTRLALLDLAGARRAIDLLAQLTPLQPTVRALEDQLALMAALPREVAEARQRLVREVPLVLQHALKAGADLIDIDPSRAIPILEAGIARCVSEDRPVIRELAICERFRFVAVLAYYRALGGNRVDPDARAALVAKARDHADRVVAVHPSWPSGYLLRAFVADAARGATSDEISARVTGAFAEAVAHGARDPVLDDIGTVMGTQHPLALFGLMLAWGLETAGRGGTELRTSSVALLGDLPIAAPLRALGRHPALALGAFLKRRSDWDNGSKAGPDADPQTTLAALRDIESTMPADRVGTAGDAVAQWFLPLFYKAYLPLEQEIGSPATIVQAGIRYLRMTTGIATRPMFRESLLELRARAVELIGAALGQRATDRLRTAGARLAVIGEALDRAIAAGDAARVREHLDALATGALDLLPTLRADVETATAAIGEAAGVSAQASVELALTLSQRGLSDRVASPNELARFTAVPGVAGSEELARYLAMAKAMRAGIFIERRIEDLVATIADGASDAVAADTGVRVLRHMREWLAHEGAEGTIGKDALADLDRASAELRARIRLAAFRRAGPNDAGAEGTAATGSAGGGAKGWLRWGVAGVLGALAIALVAVPATRRRWWLAASVGLGAALAALVLG